VSQPVARLPSERGKGCRCFQPLSTEYQEWTSVIAELEKLTGVAVRRAHVDKGYRGHNHPNKFRVWISGQMRRTTKAIRREMRRRAAVEPVIGHIKAEHRMDRNYLKGRGRLQLQPAPQMVRGPFARLVCGTPQSHPRSSNHLKIIGAETSQTT
jgi:hypothetical protein